MDKRASAIFAFLSEAIIGILVFVVFSHIRPVFSGALDLWGRVLLIFILFAGSLMARRKCHHKPFGRLLFAFFTASVAIGLDLYLPTIRWILNGMSVSIQSPLGIALDKLDSTVIIIMSILILNRLSGGSLGSLYLKRGKLWKGLAIGIIAFAICVSGSLFVAQLFGAKNLSLSRIIPWIPYILIFILANALNEELLFRGLFLGNKPHISSRFWSNLAISIPFVLHHTGINYTNDSLLFLAYLLPLSLAWGYIAQETESLLGSVLFHAGTDIPVILVIFSKVQ